MMENFKTESLANEAREKLKLTPDQESIRLIYSETSRTTRTVIITRSVILVSAIASLTMLAMKNWRSKSSRNIK